MKYLEKSKSAHHIFQCLKHGENYDTGGTSKSGSHLTKSLIKDSIQTYNTERPHLSCHMKTPEYMHGQSKIKIKTYRRKKRIEDLNPILVF